MLKYARAEKIWLKAHPEYNERWLQDRIAEDPKIIGLGDLILRDRERIQPKAGRLDLLLQDIEEAKRYEVEMQLGATDESHVIRTIEYWDIERKRYPQYDHCAVLIAEDITSRFLNVISLFNGSVPLIAIQLSALRIEDTVSLAFTTVLNELSRGPVDEDEDAEAAPTDRAYWEDRASKQMLAFTDELVGIVQSFAPGYQLKYNRYYIGLALNGEPDNFLIFRPRKNRVVIELRLPRTDDIEDLLEKAGLVQLEYATRWGRYRIPVSPSDAQSKRDTLLDLFQKTYANRHK